MRSSAHILHADLDAFYASVEQRDDPALRGRPVIVGGGVVLAASYEAKECGVATAMSSAQWRPICPQAIVVPPRFEAYSAASAAVFDIFRATTPQVEPISIDEAFLDVGGLLRVSGPPLPVAIKLRARVLAEVGLPITVGVARTKFLAKVASGVAKPDGLLYVPPESELEFLHPLPVRRLWGVGKVTAAKLAERGVFTVGEVAELPAQALIAMLGAASGRQLFALAHNHDPRPVVVGRRRRSIGAQRALGRSRSNPAEVEAHLLALLDRVALRLRRARRLCRTVTVRFRFADFTRATRGHTLPAPTDNTAIMAGTARQILSASRTLIAERGLTLIGITLSGLDDAETVQLELPYPSAIPASLDAATDRIRDRYGAASLTRAATLGQRASESVPLLPD
ncbi:MAG TPA: DNA polymerase IV [Jatrophihabitans sp.]|nr:DNA polymerase IV [Jatrophihabitans sp.]